MNVPDISGHWVGNTYGTHPRLVYAVLTQTEREITADIRAADGAGNVSRFVGNGQFGDQLRLTLTEQNVENPATVTVLSRSVADTKIEATWESTTGAGGILSLGKHHVPTDGTQLRVPRVESRETPLSPVKLNRTDLAQLVEEVEKALPGTTGVAISASTGINKTTNFAADFLKRRDLPLKPSELVLAASKAEGGQNKVVRITVGRNQNTLIVEWLDLQWVVGVSEVLSAFFRQRSNKILDIYRRHVGNFNAVAFLASLVLLPELAFGQRAIFVVALVCLLFLHRMIILRLSETSVDLSLEPAPSGTQLWPTILSLATTTVGTLIAGLIFGLMKYLGWPYDIP